MEVASGYAYWINLLIELRFNIASVVDSFLGFEMDYNSHLK